MTTSLTIPVSALSDWRKFARKMDHLGRLTDEEIDPRTWGRAFKAAGVAQVTDIAGLAGCADGEHYLKISFSIVTGSGKQVIQFSGSPKPIKFTL